MAKKLIQDKSSSLIIPMPILWLLSSILFFFIAVVVAPRFWPQMNKADQVPAATGIGWVLGIAGIIIYFTEPLIWHFNTLNLNSKTAASNSRDDRMKPDRFSYIVSIIAEGAVNLVVMLPAMVISMFKPVLRALVLFTSLSFFGSMKDDTALYSFFAVIVTIDVLLYYITQLAPNWKYNPVNMALKMIGPQQRPHLQFLENILLIIHTALIYSLLLTVVYYDISKHPEKLNLRNLALWWLILTVYNRLSFSPGLLDKGIGLKGMGPTSIFITILTLVISLLSFIWPFYFA